MDRLSAHRELRELLAATVAVLGERRAALGAGCSRASIAQWLRAPQVLVHAETMTRVLPRLRQWERWVPGYQAAQAEIRKLEEDEMVCWANRVGELRDRLGTAWEHYSLPQLELGCEVSERHLLLWRSGMNLDRCHEAFVRALGHLRHVDSWPAELSENGPKFDLAHVPQGPPGAGMTGYDHV